MGLVVSLTSTNVTALRSTTATVVRLLVIVELLKMSVLHYKDGMSLHQRISPLY